MNAHSKIGHNGGPPIEVVWRPIPGSSQELALDSRAHHTLFCGSRGPGKTDCQLMAFRKHVGRGYSKFWRGVIFDREYKALEDIISKSTRWFPAFDDGAKWLSSKSDYKWVWPTGEELLFREYKNIEAYMKYHGQEFPFIGFNELTKWATSDCYDKIMSCNRSSFTPEKDNPELPPIPLMAFSTTNSGGPGHAWVKKRFIDPVPYGKVIKKEVEVFDPKTKKDIIVTRSQISIFGSYKENPYLDPQYIAELASIEDENLRRSYLTGDWNISAGGAVSDIWSSSIHVIPRSVVPSSWYVDRSFDWGSTDPFAVSWWAEANGEEMKLSDGRIFCPPPGSLIKIAEWYGSHDGKYGDNKGSKLGAADIADGIKWREAHLVGIEGNVKWVNSTINPGPADNQIRNVNESNTDTLEKMMADRGVRWTKSDKSKGSIAMGLQLIRDRLSAAVKHAKGQSDGPGIYFMDNCRVAISSWPNLPRDELKPDEIDRNSEHHDFDTGRYRVLASNNRIAKSIGASFAGSR